MASHSIGQTKQTGWEGRGRDGSLTAAAMNRSSHTSREMMDALL